MALTCSLYGFKTLSRKNLANLMTSSNQTLQKKNQVNHVAPPQVALPSTGSKSTPKLLSLGFASSPDLLPLISTMKLSLFTVLAVAVACMTTGASAEAQSHVRIHVHEDKQSANGAICYKACPSGQYCPRGETNCRAPSGSECFNPATSLFISKCDAGFKCSSGKCVYAKHHHKEAEEEKQSPNGAICYKACPSGQYCPRGETNCRAPTGGQCFNPATSLFIGGCDPGFKCSNGKCVYAKHHHHHKEAMEEMQSANGAICYKACPSGQYCPRGETQCRKPAGTQCFDPSTSLFIHNCAAGFKCSNGKCVYKKHHHHHKQSDNGAICYKACPSGQYCPRGETECRAPWGNQCFNPATSLFINGCDPGFKCSNGKCVYA